MTPIYSYPSDANYSGALSGAMTALSGGLLEIDAADSAKKRLQVMADELGARGLVGDAHIYQSIADDTTPNFLQAAITGKPTDHGEAKLTDHALRILQADRALKVKEMQTRDQTFLPNLRLSTQELNDTNQRIATLQKERDKVASQIANPGAHDPTEMDALIKDQERIDSELNDLNTHKAEVQGEAKSLVDQHKTVASGKSVSTSDRKYYSENQNPGMPALPGADFPIKADPSNQTSPPSLFPFSNGDGSESAAPIPVKKALPANVPGTDLPNVPVSPLSTDQGVAAGRSLYSPFDPTPLLDSVTKPTPKSSSVTEPVLTGDPRKDSKTLFDRDVEAARETYGDAIGYPKTRPQLKAIITKLHPETSGPLIAKTQEEADAIVEREKAKGNVVTQKPTSQGTTALSIRPPSTSSTGLKTGLSIKMGDAIYYVQNGQVFVYRNGRAEKFIKDGVEVTPTKLLEIQQSYDRASGQKSEIIGNFVPEPAVIRASTSSFQSDSGSGHVGGNGLDYYNLHKNDAPKPP